MKIKRSIVETIEVPDDVELEDAMALLSNPPGDEGGDDGDGEFDDDDSDSDADDSEADEAEESDA